MGMCVSLFLLSDANVERLLRDPPQVWRVVAPDDPDLHPDAPARRPSLLSRLFGGSRASARSEGLVLDPSRGEGEETDLDKAWHGIHYLLTGAASGGDPPLNLLVDGGTEVGDVDVGYGPARVLSAADARLAHERLAALDDATLRARFDPAEMLRLEIYPDIWARSPEEDDVLGYLMEYVQDLRRILAQAVENGFGLLICVR